MKRAPHPDRPHPDFDGHLETPWKDLTSEQKLDWIWSTMQVVRRVRTRRGESKR